MVGRKTKITLVQTNSLGSQYTYVVVGLTNRTRPVIGQELTEEEVKKLLSESFDLDLTVDIKPAKACS